jgi:hypothetical protein
MITESELYWILKLDDIRLLLGLCTTPLAVASVVLIVMTIAQSETEMYNDSDWRRGRFARLAVYITLIVFSVTLVLLPSTKQMAAIKGIPAIVNSEAAKNVSSDVKELYKLGIDTLKEKLTDTNSNKEK